MPLGRNGDREHFQIPCKNEVHWADPPHHLPRHKSLPRGYPAALDQASVKCSAKRHRPGACDLRRRCLSPPKAAHDGFKSRGSQHVNPPGDRSIV
jgi:hypothetical protein